jgi:hypothetical protein
MNPEQGKIPNHETTVTEPVAESNSPNNENLRQLLTLTREMLALADEGDRDRDDASCGIIYGILRDCAYQLRKLADKECENHREAGKWS